MVNIVIVALYIKYRLCTAWALFSATDIDINEVVFWLYAVCQIYMMIEYDWYVISFI